MGTFNTMETSFNPDENEGEAKKEIDKEPQTDRVFGETTSSVCSELYALMLVSICLVLLTIELVNDTTPLHYHEVGEVI